MGKRLFRCLIMDTVRGIEKRKCIPAVSLEEAIRKVVGNDIFYAMYGSYNGQRYITAYHNGKDYYVYEQGDPIRGDGLTFEHLINKVDNPKGLVPIK